MDVVGDPGYRQGVQAALARLAVEESGNLDGIRIEQVQDRAERALEVDEPVVVSPVCCQSRTARAQEEIGRCARLQGSRGLLDDLVLFRLDELDLLARLLLELGNDLPHRLVRLRVKSLVPPDHEVGGPRDGRQK
jgi:hypothetical protein